MVYQNSCSLSSTSVLVCYSCRSVPKCTFQQLYLQNSQQTTDTYSFLKLMLAFELTALFQEWCQTTSAKWPPQSKSKQLHGKLWMRSFLVNDTFVDCERVPPYIIMFLSEGQHNINTINHAAVMNQLQSPLLYGYLLAEAFFKSITVSSKRLYLYTAVGTMQYNGYCNPTAHRCRWFRSGYREVLRLKHPLQTHSFLR